MSISDSLDSKDSWASLETLVHANWERLRRLTFYLVGDWDEAEDIVLEAFARLAERPPKHLDQPQGWLYRVAMRLGLNALRARKRRRFYEERAVQGHSEVQESMQVEQAIEQNEQRENVRQVLAEMKTRQAQILLLYHSGFRYAEIANLMHIAPGSVGTLLARAERSFAKLYRKRFADSLPNEEG